MLVLFVILLVTSSITLGIHAYLPRSTVAPCDALRSNFFIVTASVKEWQVSATKQMNPDESNSSDASVTDRNDFFSGRRFAVGQLVSSGAAIFTATAATPSWASSLSVPSSTAASAKKCSDIESCREIGDVKLLEKMAENPITSLPNGVKYKILQPPTGLGADRAVAEGSTIDLIYSITGSGRYMYSQGFGYENVNFDGKMQKDLGLDSLRIVVGKRDVPLGVEQALIGMKRGERRRVVVPANVGFSTSEWKPEPTSRNGKATLAAYRQVLEGRGSTQPPFPAPTFWDVEVLSIKKL